MNIIKKLRTEAGLSQASFCEKAGLKLQAYQHTEQNGSIFSLRASTLYAIAKTFGVTSEYIIDCQIKEIITNLEDASNLTYLTYNQLADVCSKEELKKYYEKYKSDIIKKSIDECVRRSYDE